MNIEMIRAAATRLKGHIHHTPILHAPGLDAIAGRRVLVKAESLQITGSFKARGGWSALTALPAQIRQHGVIAYSSGNHAQGVARAAQAHDVPAVIVMPSDAPRAKIEGTKALGAEVVLYDRAGEDRNAVGTRIAAERNLTLIKPYDEPEVIAGQGTTGLEIAAQAAEHGVTEADVMVCCGGGGLTAGIALALAADAPGLRARPVEPEGFDDATRSMISGRIERNAALSGSICDAVLTNGPGELTFPILARLCGPGVVVTDDQAQAAMRAAFQHLHLVLEPGGAIGLAAALFHPEQTSGPAVIAVATGGNVDPEFYAQTLTQ